MTRTVGRLGVPSHDQPDMIVGTLTPCRRSAGRAVRHVRDDASRLTGCQKLYGFLVFQFSTSASFQLNCGFSPLESTEYQGPS